MDLLKVGVLATLFGCAKVGYISKQAKEQVYLIVGGEKNEDVLENLNVDPETKKKIREIIKYKEFFVRYFQLQGEELDAYNKTILLDRQAVSHLVISSPINKIKPVKECFPFTGCFPYLGFFKEGEAKKYATKQEEKGLSTYTRPVYAYSSLGHWNDRILSSFFHFESRELANLVFHELFHHIFFIKNEVSLNENLANFFAEKLCDLYFKEKRPKNEDIKVYNDGINKSIEIINQQIKSSTSREDSQRIIERYLSENVLVKINAKMTKKLKVDHFKGWNSARLAARSTYHEKADQIEELSKRFSSPLKLYQYLENKRSSYEKSSEKKGFMIFLKQNAD